MNDDELKRQLAHIYQMDFERLERDEEIQRREADLPVAPPIGSCVLIPAHLVLRGNRGLYLEADVLSRTLVAVQVQFRERKRGDGRPDVEWISPALIAAVLEPGDAR